MVNLIAQISELVGRFAVAQAGTQDLRLRRANRIRTIHGSLAIEGNTLSEAQITAILNGKPVMAPPREIQEVKNAIAAYDRLPKWHPEKEGDLLKAHAVLMAGLLEEAGCYRKGGVGVMAGRAVIHMAPPAKRVPVLMRNLFQWLAASESLPLITSAVFHYEFEFIHPFMDGNGRIGRLWQTLILSQWQPLFTDIPVESLIHKYQVAYYQALQESTEQANSAPFIEFMLHRIFEAVTIYAPQVSPQVERLLTVIRHEMTATEIQKALNLQDRKSFRLRYLEPALKEDLIEMTIPEKPNSRLQKYRLTSKGGTHKNKD